MNIFIDTSALLAVMNGDDANHRTAKLLWEKHVGGGDTLVCHNYILVETSALTSRRLGIEAVHVLEKDIVPVLHLLWVNPEIHQAAVGAHLGAGRRTLSLVDCVSFEIMRRTGLRTAFAFDRHFEDYGYERLKTL